ncbi:CAP domain-containing protein [Streptomyces sp. NPDC059352]|uniref:CAP domain-containing protein n=1 Tax=Streptomyces sp. NPDC059352 TaxID=3346810 RepID=UPI0036C06CBA
MSADESELVDALNERRRAMGLAEVRLRSSEVQQAGTCAQKNLLNDSLSHCGHEVLFKGTRGTTPQQIMTAWFNSPLHKQALTYADSRNAGPAIAIDADGTLVAALAIDY